MKSKLSALNFVKNNKKQVRVMIIALSLTFMTMYIICFLLLTTGESSKTVFLERPKKVAFVSLTPETLGVEYSDYESEEEYNQAVDTARDKVIADLKRHEGISDAEFTQILSASYNGIVGNIVYRFPLLEKEKIPDFVNHMGAKLIEGRMPDGPGEILVDEKVLKNNKMLKDGIFMESYYGDIFKVVGVLDSDYMTCVGVPCGYTNSGWCITVLCDEENADMTKVLRDIGIGVTEYDEVLDLEDGKEEYDELVVILDAALTAILIVVIIFLAVSILVAYVTFMRSRVNEYCLYASIGFGRKEIYGMIMREILIIFGTAIILGAVATILIMAVFGRFVLEPMGLLYKFLYPEQLLRILTALAAIIGILQIPIAVTINSIKTVDLMEE